MISTETASATLSEIVASDLSGFPFRQMAMGLLSRLPNYAWSGVYRLEGDTLVLDAYVGDETDHVRIPVGVGVCGQAVAENANQVIEDVNALSNYLSCSIKTKSEIVVLIRNREEILGQIDIDGHQVAAFDRSDEAFLEKVAAQLAARWV